jgi:hypothetical protein
VSTNKVLFSLKDLHLPPYFGPKQIKRLIDNKRAQSYRLDISVVQREGVTSDKGRKPIHPKDSRKGKGQKKKKRKG